MGQCAMEIEDATYRSAVRKRPGMYIGSTGRRGITHMALEVLENAIDLVLGSRATELQITCHADRSVEILDNGPGLDLQDEQVLRFFTTPHNGATADGHEPHVHLHVAGVKPLGLSVVTALCERMVVTSTHGGTCRVHEWTDGGEHHRALPTSDGDQPAGSGTSIRFWPDRSIFGTQKALPETLSHRLGELERLIPNLKNASFAHHSMGGPDGITALMTERFAPEGKIWRRSSSVPGPEGVPIDTEIALSTHNPPHHVRLRAEQALLFCNYIEVIEESGLHQAIRAGTGAAPADPLSGLVVVCSLKMLAPQFSGPTRRRVDDPIAVEAVRDAVAGLLAATPEAHAEVNVLLEAQAAQS